MRSPFRYRLSFAASLAAWLAAASACSDLAAPTGSQQSVAGQSRPKAVNATIGFQAREIPVGATVMLVGGLVSLDTHTAIPGVITWSSDNAEVATVSAASTQAAQVRGVRPGTAQITASTAGGVARVAVTVLAETTAPSPIVVDDFYVIEFGGEGDWGYAPQFVLRDTSGQQQSAVIGVSFDLPAAGGPSPRCAMLRPVAAQSIDLFHEAYGDYELWLNGPASYRAPAGESAVAHLTLRVPGPYAKQLTLIGRIVRGGSFPTTYSSGWGRDVLSCG